MRIQVQNAGDLTQSVTFLTRACRNSLTHTTMTLFLSQLIFKPRAACALLRRPFSFSLLNHVGPSSKILQTPSFLLQISPRTSRLTFATPTHPQNSRVSPNCRRWLSSTFRASYRYRSPPPPSRTPKFLGFLNRIPQNVVFVGIISINALVFSMWLLAKAKYVCVLSPVYLSIFLIGRSVMVECQDPGRGSISDHLDEAEFYLELEKPYIWEDVSLRNHLWLYISSPEST